MGEKDRRHDKKNANYGRVKASKKIEPPVDQGRRNFLKLIPGLGQVLDHNDTHSWSPADWSVETRIGTGLTAAAITTGIGIEIFHPSQEDGVYQGVVDGMNGKSLLSQERFNGMMEAVQNSGDPLLQKISTQLLQFHTSSQKPSDLPEWISSSSFPLPITYDSSEVSQAMYQIETGNADTAILYRPAKGQQGTLYEIVPVSMGIKLGDNPYVQSMGPLLEGMILCKEMMSHTFAISASKEYYTFVTQNGIANFSNPDNTPLSATRQQNAGVAAFYLSLLDENNSTWKAVDGLPIFIVGGIMLDLIENGKFTMSIAENLNNQLFEAANDLQRNPQIRNDINNIRAVWTNSPGNLPDSSIFVKSLSKDVLANILTLYHK